MTITFHPLVNWPRTPTPTKERLTSPFKAPWMSTVELMQFELAKVNARDVSLFVDTDLRWIRANGWVKADAVVREPGVVLAFTLPAKGRVMMPCDRFNHWQDNFRAIALSLEALRKMDRYGVTATGEQYSGFRALPAPSQNEERMTPTYARQVLADAAGGGMRPTDLETPEAVTLAFRAAARLHHPDYGGDRVRYELIVEARKALQEVSHGAGNSATHSK